MPIHVNIETEIVRTDLMGKLNYYIEFQREYNMKDVKCLGDVLKVKFKSETMRQNTVFKMTRQKIQGAVEGFVQWREELQRLMEEAQAGRQSVEDVQAYVQQRKDNKVNCSSLLPIVNATIYIIIMKDIQTYMP